MQLLSPTAVASPIASRLVPLPSCQLSQGILTEDTETHRSTSTPSSAPSTVTRYSESEVPSERDDWWYKGTDNLFLNRSGERRMRSAKQL